VNETEEGTVSIVARVFVVLNLLLSVIFLVFALQVWTAQTKWQKMYEMERKTNIELKDKNQFVLVDLAKKNVQKEEVLRGRQQTIADLKVQVNDLRDRLLNLQGELGKAQASSQMQQVLNEELMRELNRRSEQLTKKNQIIIKQQQAVEVARNNETKVRNEKAELENDLNSLRSQFAQILRDKKKMEQDLAEQTQRITAAIQKGVPMEMFYGQDPEAFQKPLPDARVLAVRPELDLVMISIGSNHGAKPGYRMTISRGAQFLAKAEIQKVYPDMCSARLFLKQGDVQVNDQAVSRVPGTGGSGN
jgi:hypothetical protein